MVNLVNFNSSPMEQLELLSGKREIILRCSLELKKDIVNSKDIIFFSEDRNRFYQVEEKMICNSFEQALSIYGTEKLFPRKSIEDILKEYNHTKRKSSKWKYILFKLKPIKSYDDSKIKSILAFNYKPLDY